MYDPFSECVTSSHGIGILAPFCSLSPFKSFIGNQELGSETVMCFSFVIFAGSYNGQIYSEDHGLCLQDGRNYRCRDFT